MFQHAVGYNRTMLDENEFRRRCDVALESLKRSLLKAEENAGIETEEQGGVLNVTFEEPPAKFVVTPNTPVRQIWISARSTSFKLDWSEHANGFIYERSGETLKQLLSRLINEQLGEEAVMLV